MVKVRVSTISQKMLNVTNVLVTNVPHDERLGDERLSDERLVTNVLVTKVLAPDKKSHKKYFIHSKTI